MAGEVMASPLVTKAKLRVGLLLDSFTVPAWVYEMLVTVRQSPYAEINLIVLNDCEEPKRRSLFARLVHGWRAIVYVAYSRLDARFFPVDPDAFERRDATELLRDVPVVRVKPHGTKHSDSFHDEDVAKIEQHKIDVLVRLGFRILRGKILQGARYGVWSYHHGDNEVNRGGPPGFWEVFQGHPVTGAILQRLTEDLDNGAILYRSFSATDRVSVRRNRNNYYWKSVSFLPRALQQLHACGGVDVNRRFGSPRRLRFYSRPLYVTPKNGELLGLLIKQLLRYAKRKLHAVVFSDQWILLFDLRNGPSESLWRFKRMIPPRDRFWADPHVVYKDGRYHIFLEEFLYKSGKAHISLIEMDETGKYFPPKRVLERPYHLSYPFVFEWNGTYYMIPESSANRSIEVYKCVEFPDKWEFCATLMENVSAVDATLFCDGRKWWLFANMRERAGASKMDELFLFYADTPLSTTWTPHPANPVVSDVRRSRPAGGIIEHCGQLYRPSQDCGVDYGYGVRINRIVALSETEYREEEVSSIDPGWARDLRGVHTLSHANRLTVIDANRPRFRLGR
ncbi:MAG TPA: hypothetical protein VM716_12760 [Gemmatimonadales bacterium]|nr:hypothetical protein [Gemmatimonadales bacterium]